MVNCGCVRPTLQEGTCGPHRPRRRWRLGRQDDVSVNGLFHRFVVLLQRKPATCLEATPEAMVVVQLLG